MTRAAAIQRAPADQAGTIAQRCREPGRGPSGKVTLHGSSVPAPSLRNGRAREMKFKRFLCGGVLVLLSSCSHAASRDTTIGKEPIPSSSSSGASAGSLPTERVGESGGGASGAGFAAGVGGTGVAVGGNGGGTRGAGLAPGIGGSGPAAGGSTATSGVVAFPLKLSASRRYLVDQNNVPFLINQASSWGLIQSLSVADARDYLDALAARGFNAVMVSIISNDVRMAGSPPNWQGISPFDVKWDFSTPNEAYFAHADEIIGLAQDRGMLVTLVPSYLGYAGDSGQGWADEMLSGNNSVAKSLAYGQYLGRRYKDRPNVLWVAGGDNQPATGSELENRLKAVIDGIKQTDLNHLWTAHWGYDPSAHPSGMLSTEDLTFASYIDVNGYYAYDYDATQLRDVDAYKVRPVKMFYHIDQSYETEPGGTPENIRRKAYEAMLTGAAGSSFCAGPNWYLFFNWRSNMDTVGTQETQIWNRLFKSRNWYDLVPDQSHAVVTAGFGTEGSTDFVAAARTVSGGTAMAYLPVGRAITVDMTALSGAQANVWWFDPTSGSTTPGGTVATKGARTFSPPSAGSWVLVVDDASLALPAPGVPSPMASAPVPTLPVAAIALLAGGLLALGIGRSQRSLRGRASSLQTL